MSALLQSFTFQYRGITVKREYYSHTQSGYWLSSPDGRVSIGPFDGGAPYDEAAMTHICYDGRKNEWLSTDDEIRAGIDDFIRNGEHPGNRTLFARISPFIKAEAELVD